jgi:hypothetical protein
MSVRETFDKIFNTVPETLEDLEYQIARYDLEYVDNYRVAIKGDKESENAYKESIKRGCCGRFDTTTKIKGVEYRIGCNYGH